MQLSRHHQQLSVLQGKDIIFVEDHIVLLPAQVNELWCKIQVITESQFIRRQVSIKSSFYEIAVDQLYLNLNLTRLQGFW